MTNKKLTIIYLFLFLIPYIVSLMIIGTSFNALVIHSASLWRTLIGGIVGSLFLIALKTTMHRVVKIVEIESKNGFWKSLIKLFDLNASKYILFLNFVIDLILSLVSIHVIRIIFSHQAYIGSLLGYLIAIMSISVFIGATVEYDVLTIDPKIK